MANQHVLQRLAGIQGILNGVHQAGVPMSSATKGQERAAFIDSFLSQTMPVPYRFGTGDATDAAGNRSGQLDVVVEYPFAPSLQLVVGSSRLYLAEAVAAVVEVKSDASSQWSEALNTANQLIALNRVFGASHIIGQPPGPKIPLFVAGYTGWKQADTIQSHLQNTPAIAGVLVINPGVFVSSQQYGGIIATGPWSLWGLITSLYNAISSLRSAFNNPIVYAMDT
jgi:hypothetical protein